MIKLSKYLKKYKLYAFLAPSLMILEVICEILLPKLMSDIINTGIGNNDMPYILKTGWVMVVLALLGIGGGLGCLVFASKISQNVGTDIREDLFIKIQAFSFANIDKFKTSSLITRLTNDVTQMQTVTLMSFRMLVRAPMLLIGGIFMAFSINAKTALIFVVIVPIVVVIIFIMMKHTIPLFEVVQKKLDDVNTVMMENLIGIRVVKAFVRTDYEKEKFNTANEAYKDTMLGAFKVIMLIMPIMMVVMNFALVGVLYFGGIQVSTGNMLIGDVMAFITYMMQIFMALMLVSMVFVFFSRAKVSADRINEVLETEIDIIDTENPKNFETASNSVEFKNVSFRYGTGEGELVLENLSFSVKKGETVAILGETGSGKTTLINLIPRLYDATSGEVFVNGINVKDSKIKDLRKEVAVVLQDTMLFSGTIKENIRWGNETASDEEIIKFTKFACAHDFIENFSEKYETMLGQKGINLSGGQKQRISIARALIKKPEILILDDSTSAVDTVTEKKIQNSLLNDFKDTAKIIIAQRISSVLDADKILVLGSGTIVAEGNHKYLLANSKDYQEIYNSQIKEEGILHD